MKIIKIHDDIKTPRYGTEESAGLDIWLDPRVGAQSLEPNESKMFSTGLKFEIPQGYYGAILPRGSSGCKGLVIGNLEGVIDSDFRGWVFINLWNRTDSAMDIDIKKAVAQMIIKPYKKTDIEIVDFLNDTERGGGQLGHTDL